MSASYNKGRLPLRWIVLLLLLVPGIYVGMQLFSVFTPSYAYETAVLYTMSDSVDMEGLVLFEETLVEGRGEFGYLVEDGERVSAGTPVAEIYTNADQSGIRSRLKTIDGQIALLEKSQNTSASQVDMLITQRSTALYDLLDGVDRLKLDDVSDSKEDYLTAQNKIQITTGEAENFNARIQELETQREALATRLGAPEQITAPAGGYFIDAQKAAVLSVGMEEALELSPSEFAERLKDGVEQTTEDHVGKIVSSYQWYFCGSCSLEEGERFANVKSVSICFPGRAETLLPATVVKVEKDAENDLAKVTLKCEYIGAEVLTLGQETARIIFESYTGLRINADAIRMIKEEVQITQPASSQTEGGETGQILNSENFVRGVYVKYGNVAKFRRITTLYDGGAYILVPVNGKVGTSNEVRMYDEIIVEGTDLYDGKLL